MPRLINRDEMTRKERAKAKQKKRKYFHTYYKKHREEILKKAKENYSSTKKKKAKCKMCGDEIPGVSGQTKYCLKCLYGPGHGPDAHRMAATRWYRKNYLTKKHDKDTIKLYIVDFSKKRRVSYEETRSK